VNIGIRRIGIGVVVLMLILIGNLTYLQIIDANNLKANPNNKRAVLRDFNHARGEILTSDNEVAARSVAVKDGTDFKFQREYPLGALMSQIVGVQSFNLGNTGVERTYNDALAGQEPDLQLHNIRDFFSDKPTIGNVRLTISANLQRLAQSQLGNQRGAVVLLDTHTGAILAMYSTPSIDLAALAGHNPKAVQDYFTFINNDPSNPSLPRAYRETFPPGSSFKIVTAAVATEDGKAPPDRQFPVLSSLKLPQTTGTLSNFGGERCGGNLLESFVHSCNTTFGQLGLDLGDDLVTGIERFGIDQTPPLDLIPVAVASAGPQPGTFRDNQPKFAQAAIGQNDVRVTPLQMALVAAAVGNGGVIMKPHVMADITDRKGEVVRSYDPEPWLQAMDNQTAQLVGSFMTEVVRRGTGTAAQAPNVTIAGKTGTAQTAPGEAPHAWFAAFAPAEQPRYAVAVLVEHGGNSGNDATGGRVAAPIARAMLLAALGR